MEFSTPEGWRYMVSDEVIEDGGMSLAAAIVQYDRDGITDDGQLGPLIVAPADSAVADPRDVGC